MAKAKVILKEKKMDENGLLFVSKEDGDLGTCLTMTLSYIADLIVDKEVSLKEVTDLLKKIVKEEQERRGNGQWL